MIGTYLQSRRRLWVLAVMISGQGAAKAKVGMFCVFEEWPNSYGSWNRQ